MDDVPSFALEQSLIETLNVSPTVFEILTFKAKNGLFFPPLPCLTLPLGGNPLEFLDKTCPAKTRGTGLPYGENVIHYPNFNLFLYDTPV